MICSFTSFLGKQLRSSRGKKIENAEIVAQVGDFNQIIFCSAHDMLSISFAMCEHVFSFVFLYFICSIVVDSVLIDVLPPLRLCGFCPFFVSWKMDRNCNFLDYMHWHMLNNWYMLVNWYSLNMMMMYVMCMHVVWHC